MRYLYQLAVAVGLIAPTAAYALEPAEPSDGLDPHLEVEELKAWQWQGSVSLSSNYIRRGLSLTDEEPTLELSGSASNEQGLEMRVHATKLDEAGEVRFALEKDEVFHNLLPGDQMGERSNFYGHIGLQGYAYTSEDYQSNRLEGYADFRYDSPFANIGLELAYDSEGGSLIEGATFRRVTEHIHLQAFLGDHNSHRDHEGDYLYYGLAAWYQQGDWQLTGELTDQDQSQHGIQSQLTLSHRF